MKALRYILYGLLAAAVIGLICYQAFITKNLESGNLVKAGLILAGILLSLLRPRKARYAGSRKTLYQKAYGEFIQGAFADDPKLEKKFYSAVDDYNKHRFESGVKKLMALRKECQRTADIYAVTVFTGLCLDDLHLYEEAADAYENALRIRPNSTLASNLGLCLQRLGNLEQAMAAYEKAIDLNPENAFVYNNMSVLYFRNSDYEAALDYAKQALERNPNMKQALGTAAMCYALLGQEEQYKEYYRRAVAAGQDGQKLKARIKELDPAL